MRSVSQYFSKQYRRCNINTENERRKDLWLNLASLRYFDTIVLHSIDWLIATLERRTGVPVYRRTTRRPERASPHIKHDDDKKRSYEWTLRTQPPLPLIQTCFQSSFCSWKISWPHPIGLCHWLICPHLHDLRTIGVCVHIYIYTHSHENDMIPLTNSFKSFIYNCSCPSVIAKLVKLLLFTSTLFHGTLVLDKQMSVIPSPSNFLSYFRICRAA